MDGSGTRLIVDTNIWFERMLGQERAGEVARFLDRVPDRELAMSEFSLYCHVNRDSMGDVP